MIISILNNLAEIEKDSEVVIFYACESGSRAWSFPSANSDYDVRFLYVHPPAWYLSVIQKSDVIERPIEGLLDIAGWDLKKALQLLRKSNPPLLEWLGSPIIYKDTHEISTQMRALAKAYISPRACIYHYLHMAEGNYRDYLLAEQLSHKKYLYVLRPLLAAKWIEQGYGLVPTEFTTLMQRLLPVSPLRKVIEDLIEQKRTGNEFDKAPRISMLDDFCESEIARWKNNGVIADTQVVSESVVDQLFCNALREIWGDASGRVLI